MATAHSTVAPINIKTSVTVSRALRALRGQEVTLQKDGLHPVSSYLEYVINDSEHVYHDRDWKINMTNRISDDTDVKPHEGDSALDSFSNNTDEITNVINANNDPSTSSNVVGDIFALASIHRSCIWPAVADLCSICNSLITNQAIQSVTTSVIASLICTLNMTIVSKAEHVEPAESERLLCLVAKWNEELAKFQWDGDTGQFLAPLNLDFFRSWIIQSFPKTKQSGFDEELMWLIGPASKTIREHETIHRQRISIVSSYSASTAADGNAQIDEELAQTMRRVTLEPAVTHLPEADTLDFIWNDPEEEDSIYDDESDESDLEQGNGIFDSATEISGADVTESDWSEIN
ncbi:unnamed protein product [Umbelopsis sp. WA50703]